MKETSLLDNSISADSAHKNSDADLHFNRLSLTPIKSAGWWNKEDVYLLPPQANQAGDSGLSRKPKATIALICYNQKNYIEESLQSCLDQDCDSLEILVCDDCSQDGTWEKIIHMVSSSKTIHDIKLVRNNRRLGVAGNVNQAFAFASGELIIFQAGDDIAYSTRVRLLYQFWIDNNQPDGLCSDVDFVNQFGLKISSVDVLQIWWESVKPIINQSGPGGESHLANFVDRYCPILLGCAAAYSKTLQEVYGPLPSGLVNEDSVLTLRAAMSGGIRYVDTSLLAYRQHSDALYNRPPGLSLNRVTELRREIAVTNCHIRDIKTARRLLYLSNDECSKLLRRLKRRRLSAIIDLIRANSIIRIISRVVKSLRPK